MTTNDRLSGLTERLLDETTVRAKSLIATIFGDAIAPHGGTVWLGSLIGLVAPFGINERLVRTAVLRLTRDDWLVSNPVGRRSYYSLTESGRRRFEDAHRRIYAMPRASWDGNWTLIMMGYRDMAPAARDRLRRELTWLGFGGLAPNCVAHPSADMAAVNHVVQDLRADGHVVIMSAAHLGGNVTSALRDLVRQCWDIDQLAAGYRTFTERFRPVLHVLQGLDDPDPEACFLIRTLLIHEFRRVTLRDPQLPEELLPADWSGATARVLCRNLYRLTQAPATRHLMASLETADGPLPDAAPYFYDRFGGLLAPSGETETRQSA